MNNYQEWADLFVKKKKKSKKKEKIKGLWKSTIIIWSEFDPQKLDLDDLTREAINGAAYCSKSEAKFFRDPTKNKDWDGTEFFSDSI